MVTLRNTVSEKPRFFNKKKAIQKGLRRQDKRAIPNPVTLCTHPFVVATSLEDYARIHDCNIASLTACTVIM